MIALYTLLMLIGITAFMYLPLWALIKIFALWVWYLFTRPFRYGYHFVVGIPWRLIGSSMVMYPWYRRPFMFLVCLYWYATPWLEKEEESNG
jgi:hypothetical protein